MKVLIIGGNRFVGLRLSQALSLGKDIDLHIVNRTGQVAHVKNAAIYKSDRKNFHSSHLDSDWDVIVDFACFTEADAQGSMDYFKKVGRYIFISTMSVYDPGGILKESAFDPHCYDLLKDLKADPPEKFYQHGKRRAESLFAQKASFPVLSVRFPFILGLDDYTERLAFHIRRIESGQPLYAPNINARVSIVPSDEAARFLQWSVNSKFSGPMNVACPSAISIRDLLSQIENIVGKKAILMNHETNESRSPYGVDLDYELDTSLMRSRGFEIPETRKWLPQLIANLSGVQAPRSLH